MRILHTADWHLCDRLGRIDRTSDLRQRVEQVASYCEQHAVEVLLVAGDLFYEKASAEEMSDAFRHIQKVFTPFFARGGTILAITGNHDDDAKIELVRSGMKLADTVSHTGDLPTGRLYLQNGLSTCTLKTPSGERAQFVLVPYPFANRYELPDDYRTREEEFRLLQNKLATWVAERRSSERFDKTLPTILMAHLHVRGANLNTSLFRFSNPADIQMEAADLKSGWAYVALGHIHLPQALDGVETIRYPGPLDRLDFGEKDDTRGVLLLDLGPTGLTGSPQWLPLEPTPMLEITIENPDMELEVLPELYPDKDRSIVKLTVAQTPETKLTRDEIGRRLKVLFPRLLSIEWKGEEAEEAEAESLARSASGGKSFEETVREYVKTALGSDPDQDAIMQICEELLATESKGATE